MGSAKGFCELLLGLKHLWCLFIYHRVIECGMVCNTRVSCSIFRMDGQTCIFGQTVWSPEVSTSGLDVYVEQNRKNKLYNKLKFSIRFKLTVQTLHYRLLEVCASVASQK